MSSADATPAAPLPIKLPKKEQELFRLVVTLYEGKKYTKGVQTADNILKKFPNHGETQSMKGLIFNCMGKKEEALELVKSGVRNDVKSHVCWHVFGLIHKSDNNFLEAIKCYTNALKIDENNQNILRDLSWLQIQVRDIEGFVISRNKVLESKPQLRASWVTAAVANYFGEQYQVAYDMVTKYRANKNADKGDAYEEGELLLFQNKCLEKLGKYQAAIDHLKANESQVTDKLAIKIKVAELQVLLGNYTVGKELWSALVASQPDNYRFHSGLQVAYLELDAATSSDLFLLKRLELPSTVLTLTAVQLTVLKELYADLLTKHKRSAANKIVLGLSQGAEELRAPLDAFLRVNLHNAIPSLFQEVCALIRVPDECNASRLRFARDVADFKDHAVTKLALTLVEGYITNLRQAEQFDASSPAATIEPPTALLWALYLHSHLLEVSGDLDGALRVIDEAIAHTPTAIDMQARRARIQKKMGDYTGAAVTMDECRQLDLQDRYLNNKATKYFLRADEVPLAMTTIAMFTKHEGDPQQTLYELQCNWYELELAESYARSKQWGLALRKFFAVRKHFVEYNDDMFDFHGYCMRKTTIRAYLDSINMLDNSFTHKFYQRALRGALRIFLYLHEFPEDIDGLGHLNPADRKKERAKRKKAIKKIEEKKTEEEDDEDGKKEEKKNKRDAEPDEEVFLAKDFMAEAVQWTSGIVNRLHLCDAETIALVVDLSVRRSEFVAAVDAARRGLEKHPGNAHLVYSLVRLANKVKSPGKAKLGPQAPQIRDGLSGLLGCPVGTIDVDAYVAAYCSQAVQNKSLPQVLGAIRCKVFQDKAAPATTEAVAGLLGEAALWQGRGVDVPTVQETLKFLTTTYPEESFTAAFKTQARDKFPLAAIFAPLNTVTELRAASSLAAATSATTDAAQKDEGTKGEDAAAPASA